MSTFGLVIMLQLQQQLVRREVKQQLKLAVNEAELFTFIIPKDNYQANASGFFWVRPNKEFRYNGGMYDVIRKKQKANVTEFTCISDKKEAEIFTQLDKLVSLGVSTNPKQKQGRTFCYQLLKSLYYQAIEQPFDVNVFAQPRHAFRYVQMNSTPYILLLFAPPELLA